MTENWIQQIIQDFGTGMNLQHFQCNDKGVACAEIENGWRLMLENSGSNLFMLLTVPAAPSPDLFQKLLKLSHPDQSPGRQLHAAYQSKNHCAVLLLKTDSRELTRPVMDENFQYLWHCAETLDF